MGLVETQKAILLLEDGSVYEGKAAGFSGTASGEVCFNTGMTGYQQTMSDSSYKGQILVFTVPHIGTIGVIGIDSESRGAQVSGIVCRNFSGTDYSRTVADQDLNQYLIDQKVVCVYDVDTRAIVRRVRDKGSMNCIVSSEIFDVDQLTKLLKSTPSMENQELASLASTSESFTLGDEKAELKIAVIDYGIKQNILNNFVERNCFVKVFPAKTTVEEALAFNADGYFLSNGPGDPMAMDYAIDFVKQLIDSGKPIFGICLGHQLLSIANGVPTYKMHNGHHGANQPVINHQTGQCEMTSQNHGFVVDEVEFQKFTDMLTVTHSNLNDGTVEGFRMKDKPVFSVQYHPEASPGPHDSRYLFDDFIELVKSVKNT